MNKAVSVLFAFLSLSACAPHRQASLYDRMGGERVVSAVVDQFVANVAADPVINRRFAGIDIPALTKLVFEHLCESTGGPCRYTGRPMAVAHRGMAITPVEFAAMNEDMRAALVTLAVPRREIDEVIALLVSERDEVVGK
jgi:hemoglobin